MAETVGLISWDNPEFHCDLIDSSWTVPYAMLSDVPPVNGEVVRDEFGNMVREQHIQVTKYPESYHAADILDSRSGKTLTEDAAAMQYAHLRYAETIQYTAMPALYGKRLPLEYGMHLTSVYNHDDMTVSHIEPALTQVGSGMHISPDARQLHVYAQGIVPQNTEACALLDYFDESSNVEAKLVVTHGDDSDMPLNGMLRCDLHPNGSLKNLSLFRASVLEILGISRDGLRISAGSGVVDEIAMPRQQQIFHQVLEKVFGVEPEPQPQIDLRLSAAALYKTMGQANFDITESLITK